MTDFTKKGFLSLALITVLVFCTNLISAQVVINEFDGTGNIEIKNVSSNTINIESYWLCDFPLYTQISDLNVECGDLELAEGEIVHISGFGINGQDGELGIFSSNSFSNPAAIVDYLQWGSADHQRASIAETAGIWDADDALPAIGAGLSAEYNGMGDASTNWDLTDEPSFCEENSNVNICEAVGGTLTGGPFEFCVDGEPDMVSDITLEGNVGENSQWVITDEQGTILGLPPMPGVVDFDEAGPGICLIWHLSYDGNIMGLAAGNNASMLEGCFELSNAIQVTRNEVSGGELTGGPFEFCVDGEPDMVSGITLEGNVGDSSQWVITDEQGTILGLPPMPGVVDFDAAGPGICLIWHLSYSGSITGLSAGNNASMLEGCFELSNAIQVTRNEVSGGELTGGPFEFCVDGEPDMVSGITLEGNVGENSQWVITDEQGTILGLPPMPGVVDFDAAGPGICLIWHLSYSGAINGLAMGNNASMLEGCFELSNAIQVTRNEVDGGELTGGPYEICVDGTADNILDITLEGNVGENSAWVVTDLEGNILGLPPTPDAVDFDGAGIGTCLIWHLSYAGTLEGAEVGNNASMLEGCFDLSNSVVVIRSQGGVACEADCEADGGVLAGGPYDFCVDGEPDMVSSVVLSDNVGENSTWVVTDPQGNILGLPPTPEAVDFDAAGPGTCFIWHMSSDGDVDGLMMNSNIYTDLDGCYSFSNPITVIRREVSGGELTGGPFEFCVDGEPDMVSGITLEGNVGDNSQWVITDEQGLILGLPPMPGVVDFDAAGPGICLIWHLSYNGTITGLATGNNASMLEGCFELSNAIQVTRNEVDGGELTGGPYEICVDGTADNILDITLEGNVGENSAWVVTDLEGNILGLPPTPDAVDFDAAGIGTCLIWHVSYTGTLEGAQVGNNASMLEGCFDLSNSVVVIRSQGGVACEDDCEADGGILAGGPYEFCVDGEPDMVSSVVLSDNVGENSAWVVTDAQGNILGLPPTPEAVDFDAAGPGTCFIWHLSSDGDVDGLMMNSNIYTDLDGCYSFSNPVTVIRNEIDGGELTGGPFEFCVDGEPDMVSGITLEGNVGESSQWVITDEQGLILGLPPMPGVVDFDAAGPGICLIWHLSYNGEITGLAAGNNASMLEGCFELSNAIQVTRNEANGGTLTGGPFEFCVDGEPDMVSGITLEGNTGENSQWVITDEQGTILGLPPMPGVVDFDAAGPGVCFIWNLSYSGTLTGLDAGSNVSGLSGCYSLSNSIEVVRNEPDGGELTGGPFEFCVDETPDFVSGISVADAVGDSAQWVITDEQGLILGLPPSPDVVDFNEAGVGVCLIWYLRYYGDISGLSAGSNAFDLEGCFDLSNSITVTRVEDGPSCVTSNTEIEDGIELSVYPNPSSTHFLLRYNINGASESVHIELKDIHGRIVEEMDTDSFQREVRVDVSDIASGMYYLQVQSGDKVFTRPIVVD